MTDQPRKLKSYANRIQHAASVADGARDAVRALCAEAVGVGVPVTHVARAAGVSRPTILRWVADAEVS